MELNKKEKNSILNINITNLTNTNGPPTYTSVANNGYNCNQKFFDNSVINKINQENTIITSYLNNLGIENNYEIKKNENFEPENKFRITLNKKNKDSLSLLVFDNELEAEKIKIKNQFGSVSSRKLENKNNDFDIRSNFPFKTEENIASILNTDTNDLTVKDFHSSRRRGNGNSLKLLNVKQENNNINISPYIVKSELKNSENALNLLKKFESFSKLDDNTNNKFEIKKEKSKEDIDDFKKIETKGEFDDNQQLKKSQENNEKKLTLNNVPEKNNDLDFENKNVYLKNVNPQNNRPNSRRRSAFKCLEELEKETTNIVNESKKERVNYLHTVNSIINDDYLNNNIPPTNNLNNFNKLINYSSQKPIRDRKPEIKNPATYNKITMPPLGNTNNTHFDNYHTSSSHNKDAFIGNNHNKHYLNSDNINYNEDLNKHDYPGAHCINNSNLNNKKPEYETRRRKLINNNNNNITGIENDLNLNQTAMNPISNNLINFENQIKNAGMFNLTNTNNNLNRIGNIRNYNENKVFMNTPINTKENNEIYSIMNNTNAINSNLMNLTKFSNVSSRIESRRVTTNAAKNIINNSYFGTTNKNLTSTKDKDSNKNKNFLII